jgi:hypothetical protein
VSSKFLSDCARLFAARVDEQWRGAKEGGLTDVCKKLFHNLCEKYDNLSEMDKVSNHTHTHVSTQ